VRRRTDVKIHRLGRLAFRERKRSLARLIGDHKFSLFGSHWHKPGFMAISALAGGFAWAFPPIVDAGWAESDESNPPGRFTVLS
jgi:hypothetical protein